MSVTVSYENRFDITDRVECYEEGKTFECECGQGFGVEFEVVTVSCPSCDRVLVDENASERGSPEKEGQTDLGEWV